METGKKRSQQVSALSDRPENSSDCSPPITLPKIAREANHVGESVSATRGFWDLPPLVLGSILALLPDMNMVWRGPGLVSWGFRALCEDPQVWKRVTIKGPEGAGNVTTEYQTSLVKFVTTKFPRLLRHANSLAFTDGSLCGLSPLDAERILRTIKSSATPSLRCMEIVHGNDLSSFEHVTIYDFPLSLEHLHLDCRPPAYFFDPLEQKSCFPSLKCLRLPAVDQRILQQLTTHPIHTLTSLAVGVRKYLSLEFQSLLRTIGTNLKHLAVCSWSPDIDLPRNIFATCPSLESLMFASIDSNITDSFVQSLVPNPDGGEESGKSLKNTLEHLILYTVTEICLTETGILQLQLLTQLKTLTLASDSTRHETLRPHLRYILPNVAYRFCKQTLVFSTYPEQCWPEDSVL